MKNKHSSFKNKSPFNQVLAMSAMILVIVGIATSIPAPSEHSAAITGNQQADKQKITAAMAKIQLPFIQNVGQTDAQVKFFSQLQNGTVFVEQNGNLTYAFSVSDKKNIAYREKFITDQTVYPQGESPTDTKISYFTGSDQSKWQKNIPNYNDVSLGAVFKNIEVKLKAYGQNVEKIFTVHPGGKTEDIKLSFEGIKVLSVTDSGELNIKTSAGNFTMTKPVAYQEINGVKKDVNVSYKIFDKISYGFTVGDYDNKYDLVIDPIIGSTYLGGSTNPYGGSYAYEWAYSVTIGGAPDYDIYAAGFTQSSNFPTPNIFGTSYDTSLTDAGSQTYTRDVFVARLSADLTTLKAATYIGNFGYDNAYSIVYYAGGGGVNEGVYISGGTSSSFGNASWPIANVYGTSYKTVSTSGFESFVTQFDPTLQTIYASTYGPAGQLKINANGLYADGITRWNPTLTSILGSTANYGGSSSETIWGSGLDSAGNVYICGETFSGDMSVTVGPGPGTLRDAFITKFDSTLSTRLAQRYLGGSGDLEVCTDIASDSSGNIFVSGFTNSTDFPTTNTYGTSFQTTNAGLTDNFVTKLDSNLNILASTYFGSTSYENGFGGGGYSGWVTVDSNDKVYLYGMSGDLHFNTLIPWAVDSSVTNDNLYIARFNNNLTSLESGTYIGLNSSSLTRSTIRVMPVSGDLVIGAVAGSTGWPTTTGAYDTSYNGGNDAVITRITSDLAATPGTISNLAATAGNGQVTLSWTGPSGGVDHYVVQYGTVASGTFDLTCSASSCTDATAGAVVPGLTNGTAYQFRVIPGNPFRSGAVSNTATATPQLSAPSAPTGLVATAGESRVSLTWNASVGATSYNVKRSTTSGSGYTVLPGGTGITSTSFTDTTASNGVTYYYVVSAVNAGGEGANSTQAFATPLAVTTRNYRWRNDDGNETNAGATYAAAENTALTLNKNVTERLRIGVARSGNEFYEKGTLTLPYPIEGSNGPAVIDSAAGFAYFSEGYYGEFNPEAVVKINLSNFTRVGVQYLYPSGFGEGGIQAAVIDPSAGYAYFVTENDRTSGTYSPVYKIRLSDFTLVGTLALSTNNVEGGVIDTTHATHYAYFSTNSGRVIKVDLNTFTEVTSLDLSADGSFGGTQVPSPTLIDTANGYAYFTTYGATPAKVVKVDIDPSRTFSRIGAVTLNAGETFASAGVIDTTNGYAYIGVQNGSIVKVDIDPLRTFARVGAATLTGIPSYGFVDTANGYAYFGHGGATNALDKIDINPNHTFAVSTSLTLSNFISTGAAAIDTANGYAYLGHDTFVGNGGSIIKVSLAAHPDANYRLEYGLKSTTCSAITAWTQVPSIATGQAWSMSDSANITDGSATTKPSGLTNLGTNFVAGEIHDTSSQTGTITLPTSADFTELEYSILATANSTDAATYCFRLTDAGNQLPPVTVYPEATIQSAAATAPNAITDLAATPGDSQVSLNWTAPNNNGSPIVNYTVRYGESSGIYACDPATSPYTNCTSITTTSTSSTISTLTNGTQYIFDVYATNDIGPSGPSNTATATPAAGGGGGGGSSKIEVHISAVNANVGEPITVGISDNSPAPRATGHFINSFGSPIEGGILTGILPKAVRYSFDAAGLVSADENIAYSPDTFDLSATTLSDPSGTPNYDDDFVGPAITLPFSINIFGQTTNQIIVGSNGYVFVASNPAAGFTLGANPEDCCQGEDMSLQNTHAGDNFMIAGEWTDLYTVGHGSIKTEEFGSVATQDHRFVIGFTDISKCCDTLGGNTFQIKLFDPANNPAGSPPAAITDLAGNPGDQTAYLTWTPPNDNGSPLTTYDIVYGESTGANACDPATPPFTNCTTFNVVPTANSVTRTGLTNDTTYIFAVYSENANGTSPVSNLVTLTPSATANCPGLGPNQSCAVSRITGGVLSFSDIPDNTSFANAQDNTNLPSYTNASGTDAGDIMTVTDLTNDPSVAFEVQLSSTPVATPDNLHFIPLQYLYVASSIPRTTGAIYDETQGIEYSPGCSGPTNNITGSVNVTEPLTPNELGTLSTFTNYGSNMGSGNTDVPVVLMSSPASHGLCSTSEAISYAVDLPAYIAALGTNIPTGTYSVTFTYTLIASTVPVAPQVAFSNPTNGSTVAGPDVTVNYTPILTTPGLPADVNHVHLQLDLAPGCAAPCPGEIRDLDFDGSYQFTGLVDGPHHLEGYLARSDHTEILGTRRAIDFTTSGGLPMATDLSLSKFSYSEASTSPVGTVPQALAVSGNYAYIINQNTPVLTIYNVTSPEFPSLMSSLPLPSSGADIKVNGNYAYVGTYGASRDFLVIDVSNPSSPSIVGDLPLTNFVSRLAVLGNYAYVTHGISTNLVSVINITNPASPSLTTTITSGDLPVDIVAVHHAGTNPGDYIYFTNALDNTVRIFNVDNPASPSPAGTVTLPLCHPNGIAITQNTNFISVACNDTFEVATINVVDPMAPNSVGSFPLNGGFFPLNMSNISNIDVAPDDTIYVSDNNNNIAVISQSGCTTCPYFKVQLPAHGTATYKYIRTSGNYLYATNLNDNSFSAINISTLGQSRAKAGNDMTYVLQTKNVSANDARGVQVTDTLPADTTLLNVSSSQGSCSSLPCTLGTVNGYPRVPTIATVNITTNVNAASGTSPITNNAGILITSSDFDTNTADNTASLNTTVVFIP